MRIQETRIEQLDHRFPGLAQAVDLLLDGGATLDQVQALVKERTGETVPIKTLSNYKQERWLVKKLRIGELKDLMKAVKERFGANAISESTQAFILEKLSEAMTAGAALDPHFLLKEQRLWAVHAANMEKIENEKQRLANENQKLNEARERERKQVESAVAQKDPQQAIDEIRQIYNLG